MPTYEYVCTECGSPLEVVQSIHEPSLTECPQCRGRLRKVFGNVGVVFKGSGFYKTDSRAKSTAKSGTASGSGAAKKSDSPAAEKAPASGTPSEKSTAASGAAGGSSSSSSSTSAKSA